MNKEEQEYIDNLKEAISEMLEDLGDIRDGIITQTKWSEMTDKQKRQEFNQNYKVGILPDVKEKMSDDSYKRRRENRLPHHLFSHQGDGYIVVDNIEGGRGIEDMYASDTLTKKELFEAYSDARALGLQDFTISYQTTYYYYEDMEHKMSGQMPEHLGEGEDYDMVSFKVDKTKEEIIQIWLDAEEENRKHDQYGDTSCLKLKMLFTLEYEKLSKEDKQYVDDELDSLGA